MEIFFFCKSPSEHFYNSTFSLFNDDLFKQIGFSTGSHGDRLWYWICSAEVAANWTSRTDDWRGYITAVLIQKQSKTLSQIQSLDASTRIDEKRLDHDSLRKSSIGDFYVEFKINFFEILSKFEPVCDRNLATTNIGKHSVQLSPANTKPTHLEIYQPGPKLQEFEKSKMEMVLSDEVTELWNNEWAAQILFL